jgi:hypothetical protein
MSQELFAIIGFFLIVALINVFWGGIAVRALLRPYVMMMDPDYDGGRLAARIGGDYRGALVWAVLFEQGTDLVMISFAGWGLVRSYPSALSIIAFVLAASPKVYLIVDAVVCKLRRNGYPVGARSFILSADSDGTKNGQSSGS